MERDDNITTIVSMIRNFNSHAHVERDSDVQEMVVSCYISTHTLTWSVTGTPSAALLVYLYFNSHAHVERDSLTSSFIISLWYFNSHAHVERD